jgi:DNA-binding transcriptional MerR regulator
MSSSAIRIGEVARRAGVSIDTVRYYERRQLLPAAPRAEGGFRLFTAEAVERVQFIKQAQALGFSLEEIGGVLTTGGATECQRVRDLLSAKLSALDERLRMMREFRRTLAQHLAACKKELQERGSKAQCPVLTNLSRTRTRKEGTR